MEALLGLFAASFVAATVFPLPSEAALFAYLRSSVQYLPLPGEPTREYERALAGSARCFQYVADLEQKPERKELYTSRSRARIEQLRREYPESEFLSGL